MPDFIPAPVESGPRRLDGRIQDKRDPAQEDLVVLDGHQVHRLAAHALLSLRQAAHAAGMGGLPLLAIVSGYRSAEVQQRLWQAALIRYRSPREARKWTAPPGESAHQSGRAVDLHLGLEISSANAEAIRKTPIHAWLRAHAHEFGFVPYSREPWHWEYNPPASEADSKLETP